jgi:membrane protein implicated in regulation of membrane protease activity
MTWANVYLVCFLFGFLLSMVAFFSGTAHLHVPHVHLPHVHVPHGPAAHGGGTAHGAEISPINFGTIAAFLAWFGGTGYLLTHYYAVWFLLALGLAAGSGTIGAAIVFWFLAKVLIASEQSLDPADYEMTGVLGRITNPIRAGGTGEIVFSQAGTRRTSGARSEDGSAIAKGTEVMVTRYEKGIAYVRVWDDPERAGAID